MYCGSFRLDESSSLRRCSSSLVASELVTSEIARITAYEKLSQSMRLPHELTTKHHKQHCKRNRPWTSLLRLFSYKKVENWTVKKREPTVQTVAEPPRVVAAGAGDANKRRSSWMPGPHRRWPVQGW